MKCEQQAARGASICGASVRVYCIVQKVLLMLVAGSRADKKKYSVEDTRLRLR